MSCCLLMLIPYASFTNTWIRVGCGPPPVRVEGWAHVPVGLALRVFVSGHRCPCLALSWIGRGVLVSGCVVWLLSWSDVVVIVLPGLGQGLWRWCLACVWVGLWRSGHWSWFLGSVAWSSGLGSWFPLVSRGRASVPSFPCLSSSCLPSFLSSPFCLLFRFPFLPSCRVRRFRFPSQAVSIVVRIFHGHPARGGPVFVWLTNG